MGGLRRALSRLARVLVVGFLSPLAGTMPLRAADALRIGVLHSLTGTLSVSERPLVDAVRLAVDEVNAAGGLLGRRVEIVVADSASDPARAALEAERLIRREGVSALFGCWTSACRQAVLPVVESLESVLFYPVQYEGMEASDHVVYTGSAPNQQVIPGTRWALGQLGARAYLVGSDYVFPRSAHVMIRDLVRLAKGTLAGERLVPLGSGDFSAAVSEIRDLRPDVVFNTVNGDSNRALFAALVAAGLAGTPVVSFSVAEGEVRAFGGAALSRHYAVWSYFQGLPSAENRRFVGAWKARYGGDAVTSDPVEAAYVGVHLWARAVREAGSDAPGRVNLSVLHQSLNAPSGIVSVNASNRHVWKYARVGRVRPDGQFEVVYSSPAPIRPNPFPVYRTRAQWQTLAKSLRAEDSR